MSSVNLTPSISDIGSLHEAMVKDGHFMRIGNNPLAMFGEENRRLIGAEIMPEQTVEENAYREDRLKYRTVVAGDNSRYSPPKLVGNVLTGSMAVELGDSDISSEFTGREYDTLVKMLGRGGMGIEAAAQLAGWADTTLARSLREHNEMQRWQAMVNAQVVRTVGNNQELIGYPNPDGHRRTIPSGTVANPAGWYETDGSYDPFDDIFAISTLLADKGYTISRIVTSTQMVGVLGRNSRVRSRSGTLNVVVQGASNQIIPNMNRASKDQINALLREDGLPPIETYDLKYHTQTGVQSFLDPTKMVFLCATGRDMMVDYGDNQSLLVRDVLGYTAIGRAAGQTMPGRKIHTEMRMKKPVGLYGEGYQTALPVILEPEAIAVLNIPAPTP